MWKCGKLSFTREIEKNIVILKRCAGSKNGVRDTIEFVKDNIRSLQEEIDRFTKDTIRIVGVTKTFPAEIYRVCYDLGISHVGENKVQELKSKFNSHKNEVQKKLNYHFIGHIQTNKLKDLVGIVDSVDTLSSLKHVYKLDQLCSQKGIHGLSVLLQINSTNEENKSGIPIQNRKLISEIARACMASDFLKLEGLMTMGPTPSFSESGAHLSLKADHIKNVRKAFRDTQKTREFLCKEMGCLLPRLSMGMSHDHKIAVEEGSTEIRIGSLLFGERKKKV